MRGRVDKKGQLIAVNCEGSSVRCDHAAARVTGVVTLACTLFATVLCRFSLMYIYASESIWSPSSSSSSQAALFIKRQKAHASQPPIFNGLIPAVAVVGRKGKKPLSHTWKKLKILNASRERDKREKM
jgi:hypothetical protein